MATPNLNERFSRQIILPAVGIAGQKKWESSAVLLAGEGPALEAARTALETVGVSPAGVLDQELDNSLAVSSVAIVVTADPGWRRRLSRQFRSKSQPALFAWPSGSGFSLFLARHQDGRCPCLECFEVMNPKAFTKGLPSVQRQLGALAASEALQFILNPASPLEGKVWVTSLDEGISFHHEVQATYKCPARLLEEGAVVTP